MRPQGFLSTASALTTALALGFTAHAVSAADDTFVMSGSGGVVGDAVKEIFMPIFEKESGIKMSHVAAEATRMAEIEAMVRAGDPIWDVSEISASDYPIAVSKGLLEEIDYSKLDPDNTLPEIARGQYGVVAASYSTVLVQRTDKTPEGTKMTSWADFWDTEKFPGPRSLRARPEYNLEFALLADGVPSGEIYDVLATEEGIDRAFAKLDEIRPSIQVWWNSGAQSVQLLSDNEVYYTTTYNGRVGALRDSGIPVEIVWNGGALHTSYVGIIKGTKNLDASYDYVRLRTMRPELELQYLQKLPYPNFAPGLFDKLPPELAEQMPTFEANANVQFVANEEFWKDNIDELRERWDEWMLE
ncbi:ABC transporter substrate-binding protein [Rhodobacteraceae bacterium LMO-12]|nr:ABC transporter substrate-binding protein [Rhodobacteraceae bacterium LMO-JJ12]